MCIRDRYQVVFFFIGLIHGQVKTPPANKQHTYAFFITAHNEEAVIANLVKSIKDQDYPSELIDVFVVADACTDNTAQAAREAEMCIRDSSPVASLPGTACSPKRLQSPTLH